MLSRRFARTGVPLFNIQRMAARPISFARQQSTNVSQPMTPQQAQQKAQALLDMLPGDTFLKKTTFATLGAGLASFLISKGIYVFDGESLILISFLIVTRYLYLKLSGPLSDYLQGLIDETRVKLAESGKLQIVQIKDVISSMEGYRDHTDATIEFQAIKHSNLLMEAELAILTQTSQHLQATKAKLDEMVRSETERRAAERREMVERLIAGVMAELKDPKIQDKILLKSLGDLEAIPVQI